MRILSAVTGGGEVLLTEYASVSSRSDLLNQWDAERNGSILPQEVHSGSDRKVWWVCQQGHRWNAAVSTRTRLGRDCPYCSGQRVIPGETDLATRCPEAAKLWHPERNGDLTPRHVMPGSHRKYWWLCERGHVWQAAPFTLAAGSGCPFCAGKSVIPGETDLATTHPDIALQWHTERNGALTPKTVSQGSMKRVWWRCELGHEYQAHVFSRAQGTGCPYCAGRKAWPGFNDLASQYPRLMEQWHPTLNGDLDPKTLTKGSHRSVWWRCGEGHVWKTVVYARTRPNAAGCPVCAGNTKRAKTRDHCVIGGTT